MQRHGDGGVEKNPARPSLVRASIEPDNRLHEMDVPSVGIIEVQTLPSPSKLRPGTLVRLPDGSTWKVIRDNGGRPGYQPFSR